jgi:hypothetical protein
VRVLTEARLRAEHAEVTAALRRAEGQGDTTESAHLEQKAKLLTGRIADLLKIE